MSYYPNNYYPNYSYNNMYQPQQNQQTINTLQGKVVDSIEMVKVNEVPFGGFGVFPKGDLSEVYVKLWNNNGTTQINTYKLVPTEEIKENNGSSSKENELLEKINLLNQKLDTLMNNNTVSAQQQNSKQTQPETKEVKVNAY